MVQRLQCSTIFISYIENVLGVVFEMTELHKILMAGILGKK